MKPVQRCGKTFFPQSTTLVQLIDFLGYFRPLRSDVIYQVTCKDFGRKVITAVDIENPDNQTEIHFNRPVTPLKVF